MTSAKVTAAQFVDALASRGRHHFTTKDAAAALAASLPATRAALRLLKEKGKLAEPYRGFHVIVPPEYRRLGCLPGEQFVPQLMEHLGEVYYVALLSAAELHGAGHQRPQGLQIMVKQHRRIIECGEVRVLFVARADLERTPVLTRNTPRGLLRVASPEATALELVGYAGLCGGFDNVASILAELGESLDAVKLVAAARLCPVAWAQRLGYLLELVDRTALADALVPHVQEYARFMAPLVRASSQTGAERMDRWKLVINATVEPDL